MNRIVAMVVVLMACGGNKAVPVDAPPPPPDARVHVGTAKSHTLFLNTEGVTLSPGADDATMNESSLVTAMVTLKPWRVGDAARATKIATVVMHLQTTLAPYDVAIVTTRPTAGPYDMVIVTDDPSNALGNGFSLGIGAVSPTSCNASPSVASVVFPITEGSTTDVKITNAIVNEGIAMFGLQAGIPLSTGAADCMCLGATTCRPDMQPCTIGGAGTMIDTGNGGTGTCGDTDATMDEAAKFLAAFGSH